MCSHTGYPLQQCNVGKGSEHNPSPQTVRTDEEKKRDQGRKGERRKEGIKEYRRKDLKRINKSPKSSLKNLILCFKNNRNSLDTLPSRPLDSPEEVLWPFGLWY